VLVIPVGDRFMQSLVIITRKGDRLQERTGCACTFVKLVGREGWKES